MYILIYIHVLSCCMHKRSHVHVQARQLLSILMLRRVKDQVDIPLPPKTELTLMVALTPIQRAFYKHLLVSQVHTYMDMVI